MKGRVEGRCGKVCWGVKSKGRCGEVLGEV